MYKVSEGIEQDIEEHIKRGIRLDATRRFINTLPEVLSQLPGHCEYIPDNVDYSARPVRQYKSASFSLYGDVELSAEDIVKTLKMLGVTGLRLHMSPYKSWYYEGGRCVLNGVEMDFMVYHAEPSDECTITEETVTRTIYKAICPQGKEI